MRAVLSGARVPSPGHHPQSSYLETLHSEELPTTPEGRKSGPEGDSTWLNSILALPDERARLDTNHIMPAFPLSIKKLTIQGR